MNEEEKKKVLQNVADKGYIIIAKAVKDGEDVKLNGTVVNKFGQTYFKVLCALGASTLACGIVTATTAVTKKIADKIHQKREIKAKAQAYDWYLEDLAKQRKELEQENIETNRKINEQIDSLIKQEQNKESK